MDGLRICLYCKNEYDKRPNEKPSRYKKRKYCCNWCKMYAIAKIRKPRIYPKLKRVCKQCHKVEYVTPAYSTRPFCNLRCMALCYNENKGGKNHWNWQGGITRFRDRDNDTPEYKAWRKAVFKRDGYRCVICGSKKSGEIRAHHVLEYSRYPLFRYDIDNGKTVCEDCHKEIHYGIKQQV